MQHKCNVLGPARIEPSAVPGRLSVNHSANVVEGIGQFERSLSVAAGEVAFLIAHIHDDGVSLLDDALACWSFEFSGRLN
jgi:hypothetical protein